MQNRVSVLSLQEQPHLDPTQIDALLQQLGSPAAEDLVCRAAEELALRVGALEQLFGAQDLPGLEKGLRGMRGIAGQIGLTGLTRVAEDVATCIAAQDPVATAATFARFIRTAESSLMALWEAQDPPA